MEYSEGLKKDGLVRFVDSTGEAWLIPFEDEDGGTDGPRDIFSMTSMHFSYAIPSGMRPPANQFDRVLDEYLASIKPKPKLPAERGSMIRVAETRDNKPRGVYMRQGGDSLPWRSIDGPGWIRDSQIVAWNPVKIVDE